MRPLLITWFTVFFRKGFLVGWKNNSNQNFGAAGKVKSKQREKDFDWGLHVQKKSQLPESSRDVQKRSEIISRVCGCVSKREI